MNNYCHLNDIMVNLETINDLKEYFGIEDDKEMIKMALEVMHNDLAFRILRKKNYKNKKLSDSDT